MAISNPSARATGFSHARGDSYAGGSASISPGPAPRSRRLARQCLDWSERRQHISGALGSAIADTFFKKGWAERLRRGRTVRLTDLGRRALTRDFGASV